LALIERSLKKLAAKSATSEKWRKKIRNRKSLVVCLVSIAKLSFKQKNLLKNRLQAALEHLNLASSSLLSSSLFQNLQHAAKSESHAPRQRQQRRLTRDSMRPSRSEFKPTGNSPFLKQKKLVEKCHRREEERIGICDLRDDSNEAKRKLLSKPEVCTHRQLDTSHTRTVRSR